MVPTLVARMYANGLAYNNNQLKAVEGAVDQSPNPMDPGWIRTQDLRQRVPPEHLKLLPAQIFKLKDAPLSGTKI